MSDRLFVGTRKGLFDVRREQKGWQIARTAFLGDPISMLLRIYDIVTAFEAAGFDVVRVVTTGR